MSKAVELVLGVVAGAFLAHAFLYLFLSEDELQQKISSKAHCYAVEEMFMLVQSPEERLELINKHEKSLTKCQEVER